jgi:hypothetical protein
MRQGLHFFVVNDRLMVRGRVIARTPDALADVLAQNPQIRTLVMQDMRGDHDGQAVWRMGYDIRARGLHTAVQSDSALHCAAVDLFFSGTQRAMICGAQFAMTPAGGGGDEHFANRRAYLHVMTGSDAFYEFVLQTAGADGIYVMTQDEIARYGLLNAPDRAGA